MNFRRGVQREEPEMNLVPMIDVLLVIVIFLVVTTTYSRYSELQINLPMASANPPQEKVSQIEVAVTLDGGYVLNHAPLGALATEALSAELKRAGGENPDPMVVINADAKANYQAVVNVMEAARLAGYKRITFAAQQPRR